MVRPAAHSVARGTERYAETLAFVAAWMHLKLEGVPAGRTYRDNTLMQWLMQHGLWFHQVHRSSWLLPWHRQYLYEVERLLLVAWEDIRGDDARLIKYKVWLAHLAERRDRLGRPPHGRRRGDLVHCGTKPDLCSHPLLVPPARLGPPAARRENGGVRPANLWRLGAG